MYSMSLCAMLVFLFVSGEGGGGGVFNFSHHIFTNVAYMIYTFRAVALAPHASELHPHIINILSSP